MGAATSHIQKIGTYPLSSTPGANSGGSGRGKMTTRAFKICSEDVEDAKRVPAAASSPLSPQQSGIIRWLTDKVKSIVPSWLQKHFKNEDATEEEGAVPGTDQNGQSPPPPPPNGSEEGPPRLDGFSSRASDKDVRTSKTASLPKLWSTEMDKTNPGPQPFKLSLKRTPYRLPISNAPVRRQIKAKPAGAQPFGVTSATLLLHTPPLPQSSPTSSFSRLFAPTTSNASNITHLQLLSSFCSHHLHCLKHHPPPASPLFLLPPSPLHPTSTTSSFSPLSAPTPSTASNIDFINLIKQLVPDVNFSFLRRDFFARSPPSFFSNKQLRTFTGDKPGPLPSHAQLMRHKNTEFCIRDSVEPCVQMLVEVFLQDIASLRGVL
ncbi:unnamed protein product [Pleuronectes platessa]|uniref:Nucleoporin Nup153 N-terminal domain-containing protein n=1 Tax=Pleuronectes platessa TaxID=8262 RepID=A0A9N7VIP6_PLEPL|nr:unnamed protein product [Pleuronectes platessa]